MENAGDQASACTFVVPDDLWTDITGGVAKVVLSGKGASTLPPDVFRKALSDNNIIKNCDVNTIRVHIPLSKRKRFIYGLLNYKHKQTFSIQYEGNCVEFLLIDPNDTRSETTLYTCP